MPAFKRLHGTFTLPHYVIEEITIELRNGKYVVTDGPQFLVMLAGMVVDVGKSGQDALAKAAERNRTYEAHLTPALAFHWDLTWATVERGALITSTLHIAWKHGSLDQRHTFGYQIGKDLWKAAVDERAAKAAVAGSLRSTYGR